jgi:hypothetical protein
MSVLFVGQDERSDRDFDSERTAEPRKYLKTNWTRREKRQEHRGKLKEPRRKFEERAIEP